MTPLELVQYYANLLILQYYGQANARATIELLASVLTMCQTTTQSVSFSGVAASGSFKLNYNGTDTSSIAWNASTSTIQSDLRAISGLSSITVSGSIASQNLVVTFTGVLPPAQLLTVSANTLKDSGSNAISVSISQTDETLPIAVMNAYDINTAVGVQLDVLGKYTGVSRSGFGFSGPITLDDDEFRQLITMATITNNSGSSLATIQQLLNQFFPNEVLVFDYKNMRLSYYVNSSIGSQDLVQLFITEGLLPKPMGVQLSSVVYGPDLTHFFGFRTYDAAAVNNSPFNTYDNYNMNSPWLSYSDGIIP